MNCDGFLLALEAGDAASLDRAALAHAESCAPCGRALAGAIALERALAARLAPEAGPVPAGFADRLMARVEHMPQARVSLADVARGALASFATPPLALSAAAAAALLGCAAAFGFDLGRLTETAGAAMAPLARVLDEVARPFAASGPAHGFALAGVVLAGLPLLAVLLAAAWQMGSLIGERAPRVR